MCGVCLPPPWRILAHPTHTCYEDISVGGVLLSHNPTIAVPSAQSNLATGIGTGPGVPLTLKPPTQTHLKQTTPRGVLCQTLYNKHKHDNLLLLFCGKHMLLTQSILLFSSPTHKKHKGVFCVGVLVPVTLQHVTMLTALAYQPHHLQGTSTETSS